MKTSKMIKEKGGKIAETITFISQQTKSANVEASQCYGVCKVNGGVMFSALYPQARVVQVAGDFNNWQPEKTPMRKVKTNGLWQVILPLAVGTYRYRLVVDGQWIQDPHNKDTEPNPYGELNSVLHIR
jgi:chromosome partitioning protein